MRAQSTALRGSRRGLPCTRANSPAQTSLQTVGLCEPMAGRAHWQGPSLLAGTFLLKWTHHICGFLSRLAGESVQSHALLYPRSISQALTNTALFLAKTLESRQLHGSTRAGRMWREGKEGLFSSKPAGQTEFLPTHQERNEGQQNSTRGGWAPGRVRRPWFQALSSGLGPSPLTLLGLSLFL